MAQPSASAATAAAAALRACLSVVFALLLLLASSHLLPRSALSGGHDERCGGVAAGSDGRDRSPLGGGGGAGGGGHIDYLYLFYCVLGRPALGYAAMAAWLAVLFYLLADTAAVYFCASLKGLARLLGLPPPVAGATLLALGNGAPDALSAIASFSFAATKGEGTAAPAAAAAVGLSGVLGGAMFVSSAVLGVIAVRLGGGQEGFAVHRASFFRDAAFLLLALLAVAAVVAAGEVNIWAAAAFASLYLVYVLAVAAFTPDGWSRRRDAPPEDHDHASTSPPAVFSELHNVTESKFYADLDARRDPLLPDGDTAPLLQHYAGDTTISTTSNNHKSVFWTVLRALELPLRLPRRLTIPDASKERWSKPAAVTAATLAPVFLSLLCSHRSTGSPFVAAVLLGGLLAGLALGLAAFLTTEPAAPPTGRLLLGAWLAGGFAMSVAWAYVIAGEVLSLLVAAGAILSVDSAALGVTVLAWGNSVSDLIANVAVASSHGGGGGVQVAVSGCYGGPVFNVLVGLGLSMLLSCWSGYPRPVEIPREPGLYRTLGFVAAGVLWALVMLPRRGMRVDRTLGFGLLLIYFCFLCINISQLKNTG